MRRRIGWTGMALMVAWSTPDAVAGQEGANGSAAPGARAVRTAEAPTVDGRLDEAAWNDAPVLTDFVQHEPFEGAASSERTEVRILYDDQALYVGAWMFDREADQVVFGETRRDADVSDTDAILLLFDTYLDRQNGFVFGTTPAAIEYDGQVTREGEGGVGGGQRQQRGSGGGFNLNWDGSWDVATSRDARGWYAEFRIPFGTLRYGRGGTQDWGFNVSRNIRRRNEQAFWAPVPRQFNFHRVSMAGTLSGVEAPTRRTVDVTPYVLGVSSWDYVTTPTDAEQDGDIGVDAKIGVTPSLTLDLTYNTDFAQVEVDDEQVNLDRFQLFFPEKRPFFLENAGTFSVGTSRAAELFFSRRIGIAANSAVPILGGARLSGRLGGLTVGALNIQTDDLLQPDSTTGVPVQAVAPNNFGVARVLRELPNRSRVGAMFVSRINTDDADDHNYTYALDGRLGIGDAITIDAYAALTETPGIASGDHAYSVSAVYRTRDWLVQGAFREVGAGFNPEVGFLPRRDYRFYNGRIQWNVRFEDIPWFRELRPHISWQEFIGLDGFSETRMIHMDSHFEFSNGAFFQFPSFNLVREGLRRPFTIADSVTIPAGTYDNIDIGWRFNTNLSAPVSFEGSTNFGGFFSGHRAGGDVTLAARAGDRFVASLRFSYFDVNLPEGDFETTLVGVRTAWSFTPRIYLQSLVQYNNQSDAFSANLRFGWLSTAGTGLFVVYNDIEEVDPRSRFHAVNRAFIVKFTQQFRVVQ